MNDLAEIFWDSWCLGEVDVLDYTRWLDDHATPKNTSPSRWVRAWTALFRVWSDATGRVPVILVSRSGEFVGQQLQREHPLVGQVGAFANAARVAKEDNYSILNYAPARGVIADLSGSAFVWEQEVVAHWGWRYPENLNNAAAMELWAGGGIVSFYSRMGGRQIVRDFWEAAPHLAEQAQLAVELAITAESRARKRA